MSTNRFFNLLVVMALLLVGALTVREAVATSAVLSDTERAQAADAARWTAMGEYYESLAKSQNLDRGRDADAARWTAMAEHYAGVEAVQSRGRAADAARWTAMGEYYKNLAKSQNLDRGRAADAARWTAMAEYYLQLNSASK